MASVLIMFEDDVNPTDEEICRWAYSDAPEPIEDFEIIVADPEHLPTLLDLLADPECPRRDFALASLYCLVGHTDLSDPRLTASLAVARHSPEPWVRTWADRTAAVVTDPSGRDRADWCGWQGYRNRPTEG